MILSSCSLCSGTTEWDDGANSVVCLDCGNLEDSTQTALVEQAEPGQAGHIVSQPSDIFHSLSTPALKAATGRVLAGQSSKANRDAAKSREMHEYILSIARIIGTLAIAERAQHLFDLAMYEGSYKWGTQAKRVAAACVVIALNESGRVDSVAWIAAAVSEPASSITKIHTRITKLLNIKNKRQDPAALIPALQAHLSSLLKQRPIFPSRLYNYLISLQAPRNLQLATQLAALVTLRASFTLDSTAPLACAIFILSLEGLAMKPCPDLQILADKLGQRFGGTGAGASKFCIIGRYYAILAMLLEWKSAIPLLIPIQRPRKRKGDRIVIASTLCDIVQFEEQVSEKRIYRTLRAQEANLSGSQSSSEEKLLASALRDASSPLHKDSTTLKLESSGYTDSQLLEACQFLLSPSTYSKSTKRMNRGHTHSNTGPAPHELLRRPFSDTSSLSRLQALSKQRLAEGQQVGDSELFDDGELEGLMRSALEVELLREENGWQEKI